ncbi:hypothetical protein [Erythrobacter crassostreae]|uniref:Uncharacterized protein n=1 Tax=Erythrobacter crassostreae TaxID=2828328 RepID=A0A9X1JL97_9SPHN|nr:hypothetical protein [Erythrobacter crassostrea]MBV7259915.1 hypothetical protein [Erythrobacter crassostrea]
MKLLFVRLLAASALIAPTAACAHEKAPETSAIVDYEYAKHDDLVKYARWQIIIHSGAGIPGSPGAGEYYRQPKKVLQAIVDNCELGRTVYAVATDGVSVLTIANDDLSEKQVACIRSAEDNGLRLSDKGVRS